MATEKQAPRYLQDADGNVALYAGDDIDAAKQHGKQEPEGRKANGEEWNPTVEEGDKSQAEAVAEVAEANAERQSKIDARKAKDAEAAKKDADKAAAAAPVIEPPADLRVEVVESKKSKK